MQGRDVRQRPTRLTVVLLVAACTAGGGAIYLSEALALEIFPSFALLLPSFGGLVAARAASGAGFEACARMPPSVAIFVLTGAAVAAVLAATLDTVLPASIWMMVGATVAIFPELIAGRRRH